MTMDEDARHDQAARDYVADRVAESGLDELIRAGVAEQARRNLEAVERACEQALTSEHCGVLVEHLPDGSVRATVTSAVPWGWIHEHYLMRED